MSELSYLEKLLDGVEVEWVTLGSMADIGTGSSNRQDESENGIYPFYVRSKNILKSDTFEFDEVAIVIPGEGGIGDIFHYVEGKYALHQRAYRIRITTNAVDTKFLYYFMSSSFKQYILTKSVGATAISIRKPMLEGFKVPIPSPDNPEKSLAIQSEIVRVLDKFTALTAELTAELTARKRQYNYYRDQLLSFEDGEVEWKTLDDVFDIVAGGDAPKDALSEFETEEFSIPVLSNGIGNKSLYGWTDRAKIEKPSLTISARGTIGWTSYRSRPFFPIVRLLVLTPKIKLNLKYAYYFMKTIENNYKIPEAGIPQLTKPMLKDIKIPFPCPGNPEESYNEQARIAATLDKFDVLTNSITEGLPREIELRQKQYEYYRDLLFSFPKPDSVTN
ncbi:restriction modification system DNA specificity domain-containing protein [Klebsiella pneumoniae]|uniref:restriction endonuclease subunit S n=1 Tax=Klebsiella pneumoniae TaxID=573 RepID=UPI00164B37E2|nr:restriction endonuclease subunit S [Klebsiella pneumoniae]MBC5274320.1 restriction endonuclease subunit S [Klebsiella pneumoniae]MCL3581250.1 restriction endonuclease subunit S [Klebsiella pneumoniae]URI72889.1 restriction endonuclease subunit S [Klebsiella pneumoniae]GJL32752.1 restriction modification system DNA specificity domain-containing protein [Klebsiella pneumoniae]HBT5135982.1 restriction endonuclease subunit S [Klebsiella pneumoniae]